MDNPYADIPMCDMPHQLNRLVINYRDTNVEKTIKKTLTALSFMDLPLMSVCQLSDKICKPLHQDKLSLVCISHI